MKLTPAQSVHIRSSFQKMQGPEDFVQLLNDVKGFKFAKSAIPFVLNEVYYYVLPEVAPKEIPGLGTIVGRRKYQRFEIPKKNGTVRVIHAPVRNLKMIQTCLNIVLQQIYEPHAAATGFVPGKSIVDNARVHTRQTFVYNLDLKDFFPGIDQARVWGRLLSPPFNLTKDTPRQKIADMIAGLCCYQTDATDRIANGTDRSVTTDEITGIKTCSVLPQGAPTSPTLTNIICERLDRKLSGLARKFKLRYSRYADDITFSSMEFVYSKNGEFLKELHRIIHEQNFRINESKTRLQTPGYRQEVTGLVINEQPNVATRYVKQVRRWIYLWETYGFEKAQDYFLKDYTDLKQSRAKSPQPHLGNVLSGKLLFLKMVKGARNAMYLKLQARLDKLMLQEGVAASMKETKLQSAEKFEKAIANLVAFNPQFEILLDKFPRRTREVKASSGREVRKEVTTSSESKTEVQDNDQANSVLPLSIANPDLHTVLDVLAAQGIEDAIQTYNSIFKK